MILAKIRVSGIDAHLVEWKEVPAGIRGAQVVFDYADPIWDDLEKTVVFSGCVTKDVLKAGEVVEIPPECVKFPGAQLKVGVFGNNADHSVGIPTLWAYLGRVKPATDPSEDESAGDSLSVWEQILTLIGDLDDLETAAKDTLVAAINEAATKGGGSVSEEEVWDIVDRYLQEHPVTVTETDPTVPSWAKQPQKPTYTAAEVGARPASWMPSASDVGADPVGTAAAAVSGHNTAVDAHNDIRLDLKKINDKLTAFFDSDDQTLDELSEIVAYITSNKSLIDAITTSKVNVSDIIDNLITNVANKPLSAAQGVVLNGLISTVSNNLSKYQLKGDYALKSEIPTVPSWAKQPQKPTYTAAEVGARPASWMPSASDVGARPASWTPSAADVGADPAGTAAAAVSGHNTAGDAHNDIRLDLKKINDRLTAFFDSDDQTLDELSEIVAYITSNKSLIDAITTSKVNVSDIIDNLATNVANKPLSAAQGVVLNGLISTVSNNLSKYQLKGDYALKSEIPTALPNPFGLFINNRRYDGYAAVDMELQERICDEKPGATLAENVAVTSGNYAWVNYDAVKGYEKMKVIYDGVTYDAPITFGVESGDPSDPVDARYFYVGNVYNLAPEYPFSILGFAYENNAKITVGSGAHTMSVILDPFVKKIDKKYLPDDIGGGSIVSTVILPETTATLDEEATWTGNNGKAVVTGTKYIVTIDGVEYEREAKYSDAWSTPYIGSINMLEFGEPENENDDQFCFTSYEDGVATIYMPVADYANKTVTLSVKEKASGSTGGGANLEVTEAAKPGQLLLVEEVDANGRPTKLKPIDRTHWAEPGETVEIVPETELIFADSVAYAAATGEMVADENYTVNYNGTEYICTTMVGEGIMFGNLGAMGIGETTGEPFVGVFYAAGLVADVAVVAVFAFDDSASATISIYQKKEIIKKLDQKYLPDGVGSSPIVVATVKSFGADETAVLNLTSNEISGMVLAGKIVFFSIMGLVFIATPNITEDENGSIHAEFANILDHTLTGRVDENGVFALDET